MTVTKEELEKALKKAGFNLDRNREDAKNGWWTELDNSIQIDSLLNILENLSEIKEDEIKPHEHKHIWQFAGRKIIGTGEFELCKDDVKVEIQKPYLEFVCECGAVKRVLEKEVEL